MRCHNASMNRLARERSPYLLQHAQNPVDWFPWNDEAFARARAEDKPIPKEMNGVTLEHLLLHMADALQRAGSPALRRMIAERSLQVLLWARECSSVNKFFEQFESAGA